MTPSQLRACSKTAASVLHQACLAGIAALLLIATPGITHAAEGSEIPTFAVDPSWPKPLPNNWILGQVGGITVDPEGHIWIIHRPHSLTDDEKARA